MKSVLKVNKISTFRFFTTKVKPDFPGAPKAKITHDLNFISEWKETWPVYRILDEEGNVENEKEFKKVNLPEKDLIHLYECCVRLHCMDDILYNAQRQGRVSFYMTNYGEECSQIGSAHALKPTDEIFSQYREAGTLLYRGFGIDQFLHQCFGTKQDFGKGRQMPVHYGSKDLHFQTISSPLTTQLPQASGSGYAFRLDGEDRVAMCYFGDGAASEGDFHAALNFAATLKSQTIFFCRNNGYAISTPVQDQYKGDGIVSRGPGYGIHSIRVDGNDLFAVYQATKEAREICITQQVPVLIEAMTYRVGHHSTSDDSTRYRKSEEVKYWETERNPINRIKKYLINQKLWSDEQEKELRAEGRKNVLESLEKIENEEKVPYNELFNDVYDKKPQSLIDQEKELHDHLEKYSKHYESTH
eukprot:gene6000-9998_t